jgi:hypothetical protein
MRPAATLALTALVAAIATGGCGGDSGETSGAPPAELVGTYTTTLQASDVAGDNAPELSAADGSDWTLRIGTDGGADDGPFLAIDSEDGDNLEAPTLEVDGDRVLLHNEECAHLGGGYRVAQTILTSRPWTKRG